MPGMGGGMPMGNMRGHRNTKSKKELEEQEMRNERNRMAMSQHTKDEAKLDLLNPDLVRVHIEVDGVGSWHSGPVILLLHRSWSPIGVEHFVKMVKGRVLQNAKFFRFVPDFIVQFGIPAQPSLTRRWLDPIEDDHPKKPIPNRRGTVCFAMKGHKANSRTTQVFINLVENSAVLDGKGFTPIGEVISGMEVIDDLYKRYGERPDQGRILREGNEYLDTDFPLLSIIRYANIMQPPGAAGQPTESSGSASHDEPGGVPDNRALVPRDVKENSVVRQNLPQKEDTESKKYRATVSQTQESEVIKERFSATVRDLRAAPVSEKTSSSSNLLVFFGGMVFSAALFLAYAKLRGQQKYERGKRRKQRGVGSYRRKKERII